MEKIGRWAEVRAVGAYLLLLAAAAFALLWGQVFPIGAIGVFLLAAGTCMMLVWPASLPPLGASALALGACLLAFLALLPLGAVPVPEWRSAWSAATEIPSVSTITLDPVATRFWGGMLVATCLVGIYLAGHGLGRAGLPVVAMTIVGGVAATAVLAIWSRETGWKPDIHGGANFGFLPNRNHTGTLLATGAVTAIGLAYHHFRLAENVRGLLAAAGAVPPLIGLYIYSESRAGAILPVLALVVWVAGIGPRKFSVAAWATAAVVMAFAGFVFLTQANPVKERLAVLADAIGSEGPVDFRQRVFADAIRLSGDYPLTGVGTGVFEPAFAQARAASLTESICLHPESDWLMFINEAGWPAALCLFGAFVLALRRVFRGRESRVWPLRWAMASAWSAAVFHGLMDVPWHRIPLGWFLLLGGMAAVAVPAARLSGARLWALRVFWIAAGVGVGLFGLLLVRAAWFGGEVPAPLKWETLKWEITRAWEEKLHGEGSALAGEAIAASPGNADAYYMKAAFELQFEGTDEFADGLLAAAGALEPRMPLTAIQHGRLWLGIDPARSAALYAEAIRRGQAIDAAGTETGRSSALRALDVALRDSMPVPDVQVALGEKLATDPVLLAEWFVRVRPEMALPWLDAQDEAFVGKLPQPTAEAFLGRMASLGRAERMREMVEALRKSTNESGRHWKAVAASWASEKNFEAALNEALGFSGAKWATAWLSDPDAATTPFERKVAVLLRDRNAVAARRIASEVLADKSATASDLAACVIFFREQGEWQKAWQAFTRLPEWQKRQETLSASLREAKTPRAGGSPCGESLGSRRRPCRWLPARR